MSNNQKNVQINLVALNNINSSLHSGDSAPMEEEDNNLPKLNSNQNYINLQTINTAANSNEFNIQTSILNDSSSDNETIIEESYTYKSEYFGELYQNLILDEKYFNEKINSNYLLFQNNINYKMRAILIDWLIDVHFHCNFKQKTLFQCVFIIDAYLSKIIIDKQKFQLLGIAALLISCKENETIYPTLFKFIDLTDNAYTIKELIDMEKKILQILKFDIFGPTAEEFYHINAEYFDFNEEQKYFGQYFLECSLVNYYMLKYNMSTIAVACGYITMKYYKLNGVHLIFENCAPNVKEKEIKDCARDLCFLVRNLSKSFLGAAKNKYKNEKFLKVAELCEEKQ